MGKGWTEIRRFQRKHGPDTKGRINHANLTAGLAMEGSRIAFLRMRVFLKSPVLENGTPGSVRGASGNRRPYRDDLVHAAASRAAVVGKTPNASGKQFVQTPDQAADHADRVPEQGAVGGVVDIGFHHGGVGSKFLAVLQSDAPLAD